MNGGVAPIAITKEKEKDGNYKRLEDKKRRTKAKGKGRIIARIG